MRPALITVTTLLFLGWFSPSPRADTPAVIHPEATPAQVAQAQAQWSQHLGQPVVRSVELAPGVKVDLRLIPPGEFRMGSPESENRDNASESPREVTLTRAWYAGAYEVTQAQWLALMGTNPARFPQQALKEQAVFPVENISHNDAQAFLAKLRVKSGLPFRLPTEAEWEFAARAGATTAYPWGNSLDGTQANCDGSKPFGTDKPGTSLGKPCAQGRYPANALGLFDMHGKVFEWCADWYGKYDTTADPQGPKTGRYRVLRGGSWGSPAHLCRSGRRVFNEPGSQGTSIGQGLRLGLDLPNKPLHIGSAEVSRVLVLGNSVTLHGPLKEIGWEGDWGMAASAREKDFAHVLLGHFAKAAHGLPEMRVKNLAGFERGLAAYDVAKELEKELAFKPNLVVVAVGRNAKDPVTEAEKAAYLAAFTHLLKTLKENGQPRLVVRSEFWEEPAKEALAKKACETVGALYVDIGAPARDPANLGSAERKINHAGVAGHPGDRGMRIMADRLWQAMEREWQQAPR